MVTTTDYGSWNNHGDRYELTVEATVLMALNGGDAEWCERMESSGAIDAIVSDYRDAIDAVLLEGINLCGQDFYGPHSSDPAYTDEIAEFDIHEAIQGVDLYALVEKYDVDNLSESVEWMVVHGESPTAHAVEPGAVSVTIPDKVLDWSAAHGLTEDAPDVYLLVAPGLNNALVQGEISRLSGKLNLIEVTAVREALAVEFPER